MLNKLEHLSIFDIYKVGVGPSSSHTVGPWRAAHLFADGLKHLAIDRVEVHLFGSLSKTGKGHATDLAVQLGLEGYAITDIDTDDIPHHIQRIKDDKQIRINGKIIAFDPADHIVFRNETLAGDHPNTLTFCAFLQGKRVLEKTYYSVGGGFIECKGEKPTENPVVLTYPINKGEDILRYAREHGLRFADLVYANELCFRTAAEVAKSTTIIFKNMLACAYKGCTTEGVLPGGLKVKRRAKGLCDTLTGKKTFASADAWIDAIRHGDKDFRTVSQWVSCFALAVNEQNAAMGRIVTSPTNGAAGVIPAVLLYFYCFSPNVDTEDIKRFLLVSGEVGCLFKKGATISAAVGGCQAEIGVSSAMAAAGLTEVMGGSPAQALMAAEIAMEHHLGLTCDPIGGLVQIPCIERNTMGAIKAITASNLALAGNPKDAIVQFDVVVQTMWETAKEMNSKYKETSEGGLALQLPVNLPNC